MKYLLLILFSLGTLTYGQDLLTERIWKISSRKRSIFFDQGVFHSDLSPASKNLVAVRNSYRSDQGFERIVFDFGSPLPAKVYGHISKDEKKVRLDFFNTKLAKTVDAVSNVKYIKKLDFFNVNDELLSVEISFNTSVSFDIFYLENPGRIVIDAKR